MWNAYWETVQTSYLDWVILVVGLLLVVAHLAGLFLRFRGTQILFVQELDRYRTVCLALTDLLPVLGLLGTVFSLMYTFKSFQVAAEGKSPDLSLMVQTFAPALSTTISGLMMVLPNLVLNAIMWVACPSAEKA